MFYRLVRWTSFPIFGLYFRLIRRDVERVPDRGALIVAANHASFLDPAVLGSAFPRKIHFLMSASVWRKPFLNWFYRGMQAIPVDLEGKPTRDAITAALKALKEGKVVGIFPEGGRVEDATVEDALAGVALLARRSGAPVIPVGIVGTNQAMPIGKVLPEPVGLEVRFGEPLEFDTAADGGGRRGRDVDRIFTETLMTAVAALSESTP